MTEIKHTDRLHFVDDLWYLDKKLIYDLTKDFLREYFIGELIRLGKCTSAWSHGADISGAMLEVKKMAKDLGIELPKEGTIPTNYYSPELPRSSKWCCCPGETKSSSTITITPGMGTSACAETYTEYHEETHIKRVKIYEFVEKEEDAFLVKELDIPEATKGNEVISISYKGEFSYFGDIDAYDGDSLYRITFLHDIPEDYDDEFDKENINGPVIISLKDFDWFRKLGNGMYTITYIGPFVNF